MGRGVVDLALPFQQQLILFSQRPGKSASAQECYFSYPNEVGTTVVRSVQVPKNSYVFFPLISYIHGYNPAGTDDLPVEKNVFKILGINIGTLDLTKNADLSARIVREYFTANKTNITLSLQVDGCKLDPKKNGLMVTPPDHEFSLPINKDNNAQPGNFDAAYGGYFALLPPFKKRGTHTVYWTAFLAFSGPALAAFGPFGLAFNATSHATYHLNIV
jgi:hypothetical protein